MGLVKFRSTVMLELINFVLTKMPPLPTGTSGKTKTQSADCFANVVRTVSKYATRHDSLVVFSAGSKGN